MNFFLAISFPCSPSLLLLLSWKEFSLSTHTMRALLFNATVIGIENVDISVEKQEVTVKTTQDAATVMAALQKTGKETSLISSS